MKEGSRHISQNSARTEMTSLQRSGLATYLKEIRRDPYLSSVVRSVRVVPGKESEVIVQTMIVDGRYTMSDVGPIFEAMDKGQDLVEKGDPELGPLTMDPPGVGEFGSERTHGSVIWQRNIHPRR